MGNRPTHGLVDLGESNESAGKLDLRGRCEPGCKPLALSTL